MSAERGWDDDGHTITLAASTLDGESTCEVSSISCPGEAACQAGHVLCDDWMDGCSGGERFDDEDKAIGDCPACNGTGKQGGEYRCWLTSPDGQSAGYSWSDVSSDALAEFAPGRYRLLVAANGEGGEEWFVRLKIGEPLPPAPASAQEGGERDAE